MKIYFCKDCGVVIATREPLKEPECANCGGNGREPIVGEFTREDVERMEQFFT